MSALLHIHPFHILSLHGLALVLLEKVRDGDHAVLDGGGLVRVGHGNAHRGLEDRAVQLLGGESLQGAHQSI
jgi:hypothetical protein